MFRESLGVVARQLAPTCRDFSNVAIFPRQCKWPSCHRKHNPSTLWGVYYSISKASLWNTNIFWWILSAINTFVNICSGVQLPVFSYSFNQAKWNLSTEQTKIWLFSGTVNGSSTCACRGSKDGDFGVTQLQGKLETDKNCGLDNDMLLILGS